MERSAAENLASTLTPTAAAMANQQQVTSAITRALYPGLPDNVAAKTWQDFFYVFNNASKQAGTGFALGGPVGAATGLLAGLITGIIKATAEGKLRKQAAVRWAHALGIEDAKDFPEFLVNLQAMGRRERLDTVVELNRALQRKNLTKKRRKKLQQRKDAAVVLLQLDAAQVQRMQQLVVDVAAAARQEARTAESAQQLAARQARANRSTLWWLAAAGVLSAGAATAAGLMR